MLALPLKPGVGVKVAVRLKPVPLIAAKVPPLTARSPVLPFQAKLAPGSSLKRKVIHAVCPLPTSGLSLVMVTVGASVSTDKTSEAAAAPALPARSV